jgi:hypothetical protein
VDVAGEEDAEGVGLGEPDGSANDPEDGVPAGRGVGLGVGRGVGRAVGLGVGLGVGLAVGFGVGLGIGLAVGFGVGLGIGLAVGFGAQFSGTNWTVSDAGQPEKQAPADKYTRPTTGPYGPLGPIWTSTDTVFLLDREANCHVASWNATVQPEVQLRICAALLLNSMKNPALLTVPDGVAVIVHVVIWPGRAYVAFAETVMLRPVIAAARGVSIGFASRLAARSVAPRKLGAHHRMHRNTRRSRHTAGWAIGAVCSVIPLPRAEAQVARAIMHVHPARWAASLATCGCHSSLSAADLGAQPSDLMA